MAPLIPVLDAAGRTMTSGAGSAGPNATGTGPRSTGLAGMAMAGASEGFWALDDPLEAALVSTFTEIISQWRRS